MYSENSPMFQEIEQAINWWLLHNPTRAKPINLLEPEKKQASPYDEQKVFTAIMTCIKRALDSASALERAAWNDWHRRRCPAEWALEDLADFVGVSAKTLGRWFARINDDIEAQLISRGFMPQKEERSKEGV